MTNATDLAVWVCIVPKLTCMHSCLTHDTTSLNDLHKSSYTHTKYKTDSSRATEDSSCVRQSSVQLFTLITPNGLIYSGFQPFCSTKEPVECHCIGFRRLDSIHASQRSIASQDMRS